MYGSVLRLKSLFTILLAGSTCTQLLTTLNDWSSFLDNHLKVDAVYIDFAKAFDTVSHPKLLLKIKAYGIGPQILNWLSSFLCGHSQCVFVCLSCCLSLAESNRGQFLAHCCSYYMLTISQMLLPHPVQIKMLADDAKFYYTHPHHDSTAISV